MNVINVHGEKVKIKNVEEVDVPNLTVDVRNLEQILWKKWSFYLFFVTFILEWVIEFMPLLCKS